MMSSSVPYKRLNSSLNSQSQNMSITSHQVGSFKEARFFKLQTLTFEALVRNLCLNLQKPNARAEAFKQIKYLLEEGQQLQDINLSVAEKTIYDQNLLCLANLNVELSNVIRKEEDDCLKSFLDQVKTHTDELEQKVWILFRKWVFGDSEIS